MANNTPYESKEYDRLVQRRFQPYSIGHQRMYTKAIERIQKDIADPRAERPNGVRVFEAGFGIGFGLTKMVEAGILRSYTGCEPNTPSYSYTSSLLTGFKVPYVNLYNDSFDQSMVNGLTAHGQFDEAFCIEVIEHVPMDFHLEFLIALRQMAPRLWFSSPCSTKSKEGVRTSKEWATLLRQARFETVTIDTSEWTYLYECR